MTMMHASAKLDLKPPSAGFSGKIVSIATGRGSNGSSEAAGRQDHGKASRSPSQGEGLKTLGNAAEYLVKSRMFLVGRTEAISAGDAVRVPRKLSRSVLQESLPPKSSGNQCVWVLIRNACRASLELRWGGLARRWDW